jgi:hypothetical protein
MFRYKGKTRTLKHNLRIASLLSLVADQRKKLISSIKLRLTIISFFFLGGFVGCVFLLIMPLR